MKLKRSAHRFYLNTQGSKTPKWYWVGKDMEELNIEMNGSFETKKNIQDETSVTDQGYSPSIDGDPYYADPEDDIYAFLEDLALERKSGDDCKAQYLEVIVKDTSDTEHLAYEEDCKIEITSYGGPTEGFRINFTVHPAGNRKKVTATISNKVPTVTNTAAGE